MANITLLHWNIETYGPTKFANGNNAHFINYIANLINNVNADIFAMVEVKNSISAVLPGLIAADVNILQGILAAANPWRSVRINSGFNSEAYIVMFRTDRNFLPYNLVGGAGAAVNPENGQCMDDVNGNRISFPSAMTPNGGRRPYYVAFETTDTNVIFSILSYHAMFGAATQLGIQRIGRCNFVTQFDDGPPPTLIPNSMISGDFNVDFNANPGDYANVLGLPSAEATNEDTSLQNNPLGGNDPLTYRAHAYDNIFQVPLAMPNPGQVIDLMVESAVVTGPQPPPPAAQPNVGNLSAAAGNFIVASIPNNWALNPVAAVPPTDMDTAWDFVREAISNHYPVTVTMTI
jgi:hypothetical protein